MAHLYLSGGIRVGEELNVVRPESMFQDVRVGKEQVYLSFLWVPFLGLFAREASCFLFLFFSGGGPLF